MRSRYFVYVISLSLFGCGGFRGTGTGNPFSPNQTPQGAAVPNSQVIFNSICELIRNCHSPAAGTACESGLGSIVGFAPKLGLNLTPDPTFAEIIRLEAGAAIIAHSDIAQACRVKVSTLTCTDPVVAGAYEPASPLPFQGAVSLLDPVCAGVF